MMLCLIIGNISFAGVVHTEKAATVAKKFMLTNQDIDLDTLFLAKTISKDGHELCYIFNFPENAGFIVIAATDQVIPVLAFSDANEYNDSDDQPPQFIAWMNNYYDQIKFVLDNYLQADESIRDEWLFYSDSEPIERETPLRSVNPLLSTTWDQGCYYNGLCPLAAGGPCGRTWAGCVATAMAQIMKYYNWPATGNGSHSYTHPVYGVQSANFGATTYNWASMPNNVTSANSSVAALLYHCGVSVDMDYGVSGSWAYSSDAVNAYKNNFRYDAGCAYYEKSSYGSTTWENMLKTDLNAGRPIHYRGSGPYGGHAFVCDGYQGTNHFHFNWGWSGSYNGYYYLTNLNPGSYTFTSNQAAILGIKPALLSPCTQIVSLGSGGSSNALTFAREGSGLWTTNACGFTCSGREQVYSFVAPHSGIYNIVVTNADGSYVDYFWKFGSCSSTGWNCIADLNSPGTYGSMSWNSGSTYYILLDDWSTGFSKHTFYVNVPSSTATWVGAVNTNWHNSANWSGNFVPDGSIDVVIPSGTPFSPNVYTATGHCKALSVNAGATLNIADRALNAQDNINIYGTLNLNNTSGSLRTYGHFYWRSGSSANITGSATIYVQGNWSFYDGANVYLNSGYVDFFGTGISYIRTHDADSYFNHIRNNKAGTSLSHSPVSTQPCRLNGNLYIYSNCTFSTSSAQDIRIGNLVNNMSGTIALGNGTFVFDGTSGSSSFMPGDYFNNVTISSSGTTTFNNNIEIRGNLLIESGALSLGSTTLTLKGNWTKNVGATGLIPGTSTVLFNSGGDHQDVVGTNTFNNVTQVNAGKYLRFYGNTAIQNNLVLNYFCWAYQNMNIQGVLNISDVSSKYTANGSSANTTIAQLNQGGTLLSNGGGSIFVNDLTQNFLGGTIQADAGSLIDITNSGTGTWIDLVGKIYNYGGVINLTGSLAWWPFSHTANLTMTGGVIDFKTCGIVIPSGYSWTHNITGGTIKTSGYLSGNCSSFTPTAGTFEFYGSGDANISQSNGCTLSNVTIIKGAAKDSEPSFDGPFIDERSGMQLSDGGKANTITLSSNFTITGDLNITTGTFDLGSYTCNVAGTTDIYGTLAMTNAANDLTAWTINWNSGSNDNVTAGTFHAGHWRFNEGTNAKLGVGNTAYITNVYYPTDDDAEFGNLVAVPWSKVLEGGESGKANHPIRVAGNFDMQGTTWSFHVGETDLIVSGNSNIPNGNTINFWSGADFITSGSLNLAGTLNLNAGCQAIVHGAFTFPSTGVITLNSGSFICDQNSASGSVTLNGTLTMNSGSVFEMSGRNVIIGLSFVDDNIGGGTLRFGRSLTAGNANNFQLNWGDLEMMSANSGHYMDISNGNYVNHLFISKGSASIYLLDHLTMKGYFTLNSGVFNSNNKNMYVGGNWTNNVGPAAFLEQTGTVFFNGAGDLNHQRIWGETFYNLTNAKTGNGNLMVDGPVTVTNNFLANGENIVSANLTVNGLLNLSTGVLGLTAAAPTVTVNNFTMGGYLSVTNGNFTCTDITNNGIFGNIDLYNGNITLNQVGSQYTDLNGTLNIHGGTLTVNGSFGTSIWGWSAPANLTMSGGILNFNNPGIGIDNAYTINASVSGGIIRTSGHFSVANPNFVPTGGTAELYGNNQVVVQSSGGSHFYNLKIDKSASLLLNGESTAVEENSIANMSQGKEKDRFTFEAPAGRSDNEVLTNGNLKVINNTVVDQGSLKILNEATNGGNLTVNSGGALVLENLGSLAMGSGKALTVNNGGELLLQGDVSDYPKITRISGNYGLNIESGASIAAEYALFEYMNTNGVNVKAGALVDPTKAFSNCILRNGQGGGRLLAINNNQSLVLSSVSFPGSFGNFNVSKTVNSGVVVLTDYSGSFGIPSNEQDTYNRIHWTGALSPTVVLDGVVIGSGQDICFEATQTITVGGTESFVVESGGNADLVAGQNIRMLHGTHIHSGAYLHAWITTSGIYCGSSSSMLAVIEENYLTGSDIELPNGQSAFRVYPNPTTGIFTLELLGLDAFSTLQCEIYDMIGKRIWQHQLPANSNNKIDLSGQQPGIYLIRVLNGSEVKVKKLILN